MKPRVTLEQLKELFLYEPITGRWTALVAVAKRKAGLIPVKNTRLVFYINKKKYRSSRLAWFYMTGAWPTLEIDHKNCDPLDDRWDNLRQATRSQNEGNKKARTDSRSGIKGVRWHKHNKKWHARITVQGYKHDLGYFSSAEAAKKAYCDAADNVFGEFARHE